MYCEIRIINLVFEKISVRNKTEWDVSGIVLLLYYIYTFLYTKCACFFVCVCECVRVCAYLCCMRARVCVRKQWPHEGKPRRSVGKIFAATPSNSLLFRRHILRRFMPITWISRVFVGRTNNFRHRNVYWLRCNVRAVFNRLRVKTPLFLRYSDLTRKVVIERVLFAGLPNLVKHLLSEIPAGEFQ